MRKQVIKFFSLDYIVFMFGRQIRWTRSANIIFPLMVLSGALTIAQSPLRFVSLGLLAIALFLGFGYFLLLPLRQADYDYFDEVQKYIWDFHHHKAIGTIQKYSSNWTLWVNPITILLFLCFYFLNI
ncbi:hypothetical protein [Capnocytophaga catalasegens]|uniref:Uncharacterized protein n=1 Tax=Capnocytophaga catalasegens TaxID=1004260 RepID=A0AAV5B0E9_9FLAO|nr:hypothetical protein [Capnocytophaga catalasegens]GIZ15272.1 hypothetical protein RCZ03_12720 [Capnocytophaga catalasegens]GJM51400.1 hypothetical protein RCZ15_23730 [Capnocytophaga catalasegens]GJM54208.1 hypothetical protein RCZ16_25240 [Capnocytophaga catalasegens]